MLEYCACLAIDEWNTTPPLSNVGISSFPSRFILLQLTLCHLLTSVGILKSRKGRSIATKTEEPQVSSDAKKEDKTLEDDINSLENEEEILEIDENQEELEEPDLDVNLNQNIEESVDNDEMDIIEDNLDQKEDDFSIEIEEDDSSKEDKK